MIPYYAVASNVPTFFDSYLANRSGDDFRSYLYALYTGSTVLDCVLVDRSSTPSATDGELGRRRLLGGNALAVWHSMSTWLNWPKNLVARLSPSIDWSIGWSVLVPVVAELRSLSRRFVNCNYTAKIDGLAAAQQYRCPGIRYSQDFTLV